MSLWHQVALATVREAAHFPSLRSDHSHPLPFPRHVAAQAAQKAFSWKAAERVHEAAGSFETRASFQWVGGGGGEKEIEGGDHWYAFPRQPSTQVGRQPSRCSI